VVLVSVSAVVIRIFLPESSFAPAFWLTCSMVGIPDDADQRSGLMPIT
jgi:hypothetical protein